MYSFVVVYIEILWGFRFSFYDLFIYEKVVKEGININLI